MRDVLSVIVAVSLMASTGNAQRPLRAFPGAEGFGAFATGGRGGIVYHVTNTHQSGPGSLWEGLALSGPRTIVFDIGGTFDMPVNSYWDYFVPNGDLTIAGQTAPVDSDGVTIKGGALYFDGDNLIIRYVRFAAGFAEKATVSLRGQHWILDHCDFRWAGDESVAIWGAPDWGTIQWCIVGETLHGGHGILAYPDTKPSLHLTVHHALHVHNWIRCPAFAASEGTAQGIRYFDFVNNVRYNWWNSTHVGNSWETESLYKLNWVGNGSKDGPGLRTECCQRQAVLAPSEIYAVDNVTNGVAGDRGDFGGVFAALAWLPSPFDIEPKYRVSVEPAAVAYERVLREAGCTWPQRDSLDQRLVQDVRDGTGWNWNLPEGPSPSYPPLAAGNVLPDTDQDGMPDGWETTHGLNPTDGNDRNNDRDGDGYTNLEEYLNGLAARGW